MKTIESALADLKDIIDTNAEWLDLPVVKGRNIRIKNIIVRPGRDGYTIVDIIESKIIEKTFTKVAALAVARAYLNGSPYGQIISYDRSIEKHYNDCIFYKHSLNNATTEDKIGLYECRIALAEDKIEKARTILEEYVMDGS
jgi:hypothetical protein